jgi:putative DNA methylase
MPKKLIEVALPLTEINAATAAEKRTTARLAHPAKIHQWWARRPLVASRAILFAQLVDDPSSHPDRFPTPEAIMTERNRLFGVLKGLLEIDGPNEGALDSARDEIRASVGDSVTVLDPFAGGGSIPLEAQRLGLKVEASDLNPIAVLLNRLVLKQIREAWDRPPIRPTDGLPIEAIEGHQLDGLFEDIRWFGARLSIDVHKKLAEEYPDALTEQGHQRPIVAWFWCREIQCANPACGGTVPLVSSLWLAKKSNRKVWLEPKIDESRRTVSFDVCEGSSGPAGKPSKSGRGPKFVCYLCSEPLTEKYTHDKIDNHQFRYRLLAVATKGDRRRDYVSVSEQFESPSRTDATEEAMVECRGTFASNAQGRRYGFEFFADYFLPRQLKTLRAFTDGLDAIHHDVMVMSGGDEAYADLIKTVLSICISKVTETSNCLARWLTKDEVPVALFARQGVPMVWDFVEANVFGDSSGSWQVTLKNVARSLTGPLSATGQSKNVVVTQASANDREYPHEVVICTDPPYFDNISYADLSDFFYVWLRRCLKSTHGDLFGTLLTPKREELVATPERFGGDRLAAVEHFESGFRDVFSNVRERHNLDIPMTIFYAYKQEDDEEDVGDAGVSGAGATGWEKLLQGLVDSALQVTATWPIRTEMGNRMVGHGTNSLASSVVLAVRPRQINAGVTDRQGFIRHLRRELADKLAELQSGGVQPVDMAQASIGPGMAVFTSYSKVLEGGDRQMNVGTALQIINQVLDELQSEQESEFDADTRWAVTWFAQNGMNAADFGDAQNIATARGTAVNALEKAGIIEARAGRVRLLGRDEYADDWDPTTDKRLTVWEVCQHLIRRVEGDGGLMAAAALLRQVGGLGDAARDLAYRLYEIANRNGWSEEARAYNNLAAEWPDLVALAAQAPSDPSTLF